jgi:hypothetical protein
MSPDTPPVGGRGAPLALVLGMHRSGTSAMAGALTRAGFATGGPLMEADSDNERGYFELADLAQTHDRLLRAGGRTWTDPRAAGDALRGATVPPDAVELVVAVLDSCLPGPQEPVVVKDPRISVLTGVWDGVLQRLDRDPFAILMHRPLDEVTSSLARRNGLSAETVALLWTGYLLAAEAGTRSWPRAFCSYDALLDDPVDELRRIAPVVGRPELELSAGDADEARRFVSRDLRHRGPESPRPSGPIGTAVGILDEVLRDPAGPTAASHFDEAGTHFQEAVAELDDVSLDLVNQRSFVLSDEVEALTGTLQDRTTWIQALDERTSALADEVQSQSSTTQDRTTWIQALDERTSALADEVQGQSSTMQDRTTWIQALADSVDELQRRVRDLAEANERLTREVDAARREASIRRDAAVNRTTEQGRAGLE